MTSDQQKLPPRDQLLDVAESLFSLRGFYGVTVRQITDAANLRLASVNYYFKTKEGLFQAVLARRAALIVNERKSRLLAIDFDKLSREEGIRELVVAIVEPMYRRMFDEDLRWHSYISLLANISTIALSPEADLTPMNSLDLVSVEFVDALQSLSSTNNEHQAHNVFQFITGTTLYTLSNNGRINKLSNGKFRSDEFSLIYPDMVDYISHGALSLLTSK